jgi:hypothetical protein
MPTQRKPRVLIFSQRNIFGRALFRCPHFEFEDLITEIDSAEILAPRIEVSGRRYGLAKKLAFHMPIVLSPATNQITLESDYDLFFVVCGSARDLLALKSVTNWRQRCKTAICLIDELWITQMDGLLHFLDVLKDFDSVILYYSNSVKPLADRLGVNSVFLPPGLDALRFCPFQQQYERVIDVCSIGRRSEVTHAKLLKMVETDGIFYFHDTLAGDQAIDASEHRSFMINLAKRSRYFIVNPGLINRPDIRGDQIEIGNRYFEGSAAGAILVGERPATETFETLFDWPDALIHLPYDSPEVDQVIWELDRQPERQEAIQRTNVATALQRHDWAYRWESILKIAQLKPLPPLEERKQHLASMSELVRGSDVGAKCSTGVSPRSGLPLEASK